ncbi:uracil-DNA glycosylase [Undibacterium sp. RuTC16W]|uniref:uracil-DNA glycosylase n=1 Tax=Undibacterium sp. RuTC16W TaxID=3413048 RepID=UPI003BF4464D
MNNAEQHDTFLDELGIGPVWKLRDSSVSAANISHVADVTPVTHVVMPRPPLIPASHGLLNAVVSDSVPDATRTLAPATTDMHQPLSIVPAVSAAVADMDWTDLESTVAACRACQLCEGRANTVFGIGDQRAKWLFVGEGPGYQENLQGKPFVGPAGHLLDNILRALGMQRGENTYIANIVKCRPTDAQGKDRAPSPEEVAACLPYLKRQIALIQPEVIIALGKTAAVSLLDLNPETPVGQLRGKLHRYQNLPLVVTYHPAYLLRKPTEKSKTWEDLCLALRSM